MSIRFYTRVGRNSGVSGGPIATLIFVCLAVMFWTIVLAVLGLALALSVIIWAVLAIVKKVRS